MRVDAPGAAQADPDGGDLPTGHADIGDEHIGRRDHRSAAITRS